MSSMTEIVAFTALSVVAGIAIPFIAVYFTKQTQKQQRTRHKIPLINIPIYGFFHPFCDLGGGGERVLWTAIKAIQHKDPSIMCVVYTWDHAPGGEGGSDDMEEVLTKVHDQFNVELNVERVRLVRLKWWRWLEAKRYPRITLVLQALGSLIVGYEAMHSLVPDVYIDTLGVPFTYPLVKYFYGCAVITYTHYPSISSDMFKKVERNEAGFNNVERNRVMKRVKLWYYKFFALLYSITGYAVDLAMVNSTWTYNHMKEVWPKSKLSIIFPPTDISVMTKFPMDGREAGSIICVAQYRPEKNLPKILQAYLFLLRQHPELKTHLTFIGATRNADDVALATSLQHPRVTVLQNVPYHRLLDHLRVASVGIHGMVDEHFGIGCVEYMASGVLAVVNDSGGPSGDIVVDYEGGITGLRATTIKQYSDAMYKVLTFSAQKQLEIRERARRSVLHRFQGFDEGFLKCVDNVIGEGEK